MRGLSSLSLSLLAVLLPFLARADEHINTPATSTPILVVFGDSFADTGNSAAITRTIGGDIHPPPEYYYEGRFSNGRMWPDYVRNMTGWDVLNYAVGSTTACPLSDRELGFNASLGIQVSMFLNKQVPWMDRDSPAESQALLNSYRPLVIAISSGSNDIQLIYGQALQEANNTNPADPPIDTVMQRFIQSGTPNTTEVARCYLGAVERLLPSDEDSAVDLRRVRGMMLFGLGAIHETPLVVDPEYIGFSNTTRVLIGQQVQDFNSMVANRVEGLSLPTGVQADFVDLARQQQQYANGGFPEFATDPIVDEPCLGIVGIQGAQNVMVNDTATCSNPSNHMFWDTVHVTTTVHEALATNLLTRMQDVASGLTSAPAEERSGEVTITMQYRVSGYSGQRLRTDQQDRRIDLFNRLSSAIAQNLAFMRPELMLVANATELDLAEPTMQRRALKQIAGPCVECVQNEIIKGQNVFSEQQEDFVPIETTILLPDYTTESTLADVTAEIRGVGTDIFNGSGEEGNIELSFIEGDRDNALRSLASVTMCIASVLSAVLLAVL